MSKTVRLVALFEASIALSMTAAVSSFMPPAHVPHHGKPTFADRSLTLRSRGPHKALIYGWDEDDDTSFAVEDYPDFPYAEEGAPPIPSMAFGLSASSSSGRPVDEGLCAKISRDPHRVGSLARIAAAFSPPERRVRLGDIEHVEVAGVNDERIDLQAVVPHGDGACVTLLIPVPFPLRCDLNYDEFERCANGNIDMLDRDAAERIERLGLDGSASDDGGHEGPWRVYSSPPEYPSWWVPSDMDENMAAECVQIRELLNDEEFQRDVQALSELAIRLSGQEMPFHIKEALVVEVGPAGLCLSVEASSSMDGTHVMHVQLPFENRAIDAGQLRDEVMTAVSKGALKP